jgi:hypothetical protein
MIPHPLLKTKAFLILILFITVLKLCFSSNSPQFLLVELLIKEPTNAFLDYFKYFDKVEIMVMISLEKYELRRDLLKKVSISYIDGLNLAKVSLFFSINLNLLFLLKRTSWVYL